MTRTRWGPEWIGLLALALTLAVPACRDEPSQEEEHMRSPTRPITDVLAEQSPRLMALPGVTGVVESALPDGTPCIKVYLRASDRELRRGIPRQIQGYVVVVDVSGEIRALPDSFSRPDLRDVLARHSPEWMAIPGVVGTAEGVAAGKRAIVIFVVRRTRTLDRRLPRQVEGWPVVIRKSGVIQAPPPSH